MEIKQITVSIGFFVDNSEKGSKGKCGAPAGSSNPSFPDFYKIVPIQKNLICPLKPGIRCSASIDLAIGSHCIECPRIPQCDLLTVWESHQFTTRTVSGRSRGSNPLFVNQESNDLPKISCVRERARAVFHGKASPASRDERVAEELASV